MAINVIQQTFTGTPAAVQILLTAACAAASITGVADVRVYGTNAIAVTIESVGAASGQSALVSIGAPAAVDLATTTVLTGVTSLQGAGTYNHSTVLCCSVVVWTP